MCTVCTALGNMCGLRCDLRGTMVFLELAMAGFGGVDVII